MVVDGIGKVLEGIERKCMWPNHIILMYDILKTKEIERSKNRMVFLFIFVLWNQLSNTKSVLKNFIEWLRIACFIILISIMSFNIPFFGQEMKPNVLITFGSGSNNLFLKGRMIYFLNSKTFT